MHLLINGNPFETKIANKTFTVLTFDIFDMLGTRIRDIKLVSYGQLFISVIALSLVEDGGFDNWGNNNQSDLSGYCDDLEEFKRIKQFAYSTSGLDMSDSEAIAWAQNFMATHKCNTIGIYKERYEVYQIGYRSEFLDMSTSEARAYAMQLAETVTKDEAYHMKLVCSEIKSFAYNSAYLDYGQDDAKKIAKEWLARGYCGDVNEIKMMKSEYKRFYDFAYSLSGLNMNSYDAREFALDKIQDLTNCGDLLYR